MIIRTNLRPFILLNLALDLVALTPVFCHAQTTAFTYQGRLIDSGGGATAYLEKIVAGVAEEQSSTP